MPITQRFDRLLLGATILQTGVGLALLGSASWLLATERYGRPGSYFFTWQAATALVGLGVLVVCMHLRSDLLTEPRLARFGVGVSWLLLAAAFLQPPVAATHRWISIGGFSLQPAQQSARLSLLRPHRGECQVSVQMLPCHIDIPTLVEQHQRHGEMGRFTIIRKSCQGA